MAARGSASGSFVHLHNHTEYSMLDGAASMVTAGRLAVEPYRASSGTTR